MDITEQFKKGWKTSEFWVGLITTLAPLVAVLSGYEFDTEGAVTVIGSVFAAASYIGSRTWLKRKRIEAVVFAPPEGFPNVEPDALPVDPHARIEP